MVRRSRREGHGRGARSAVVGESGRDRTGRSGAHVVAGPGRRGHRGTGAGTHRPPHRTAGGGGAVPGHHGRRRTVARGPVCRARPGRHPGLPHRLSPGPGRDRTRLAPGAPLVAARGVPRGGRQCVRRARGGRAAARRGRCRAVGQGGPDRAAGAPGRRPVLGPHGPGGARAPHAASRSRPTGRRGPRRATQRPVGRGAPADAGVTETRGLRSPGRPRSSSAGGGPWPGSPGRRPARGTGTGRCCHGS